MNKWQWAIGWLGLLGGLCQAQEVALPQAFRLMTPGGGSVVRVLTEASVCPYVEVNGKQQLTHLRVSSQQPPRSDQAATFPIQVCELSVSLADLVRWQGQELPRLMHAPKKIVVLGDTGCRTKWPAFYQSCNDPQQWPLAQVAHQAAAEHPDAVIHVGDYAYRESPCPTGGCAGSPHGYGWDVWQADFFSPMAPLLAAAPWLVVRGNHESCARAGQGWFRFLDPFPYDGDHACAVSREHRETPDPPYAVALGEGVQWIVMDSGAVSERKPHDGDPEVAQYASQFATVSRLAAQSSQNWLMMHHPVLGYGYLPLLGFEPANPVLSAALAHQHYPDWIPGGIQMVLQGHVHTFELSQFQGATPLGLIAGIGGDMLEPAFPNWIPGHAMVAPGVRLLQSVNDQHYGYLVLEEESPGQWLMTEKTPEGQVRRRCQLSLSQVPYDFHCVSPEQPVVPSLSKTAQTADYLLLGEVHDNVAGQALRAQWVQELAVLHPAGYGLAFEQLMASDQGALDVQQEKLSAKEPDEAGLRQLATAGGFQFKGWHWEFYRPLLHSAISQHWTVLGTNLERAQLMAIMTGKTKSTVPAHWSTEQQQTLTREVREGHCNLLPSAQLPGMVAAQQARDRSMAETLVNWHRLTGKPVILLAGNGHLRRDTAVPVWLQQLDPGAKVVSVAFLEPDGESDDARRYDERVDIPLQSREDPCVALRKRLKLPMPRQ